MRLYRKPLKRMVDVTGIEPVTPCLQNIPTSSNNLRIFKPRLENSRRSATSLLCSVVAECSWLHVGSLQKSLQSPAIESGAGA
jgi:hypothetical protein